MVIQKNTRKRSSWPGKKCVVICGNAVRETAISHTHISVHPHIKPFISAPSSPSLKSAVKFFIENQYLAHVR
jgi:hypothetical protein